MSQIEIQIETATFDGRPVGTIRTARIGNRSLTLSAARQLDVIDFPDMDPIGRVRLHGHHVPCAALGYAKSDRRVVLGTPAAHAASCRDMTDWCKDDWECPNPVACIDTISQHFINALDLIVLAGLK